jgi:hypothetical protein
MLPVRARWLGRPARTVGLLVVLAFAATSGAATAQTDTVWLCRPDVATDPCRTSLETTVYTSATETRIVTPSVARKPKVDCFYVYPTVSGQLGPNADKSIDPEIAAVARHQVAPFSQRCRIFAPVYRQITVKYLLLSAVSPVVDRDAIRIAYSDVRAAWREYMRRYNRGRGVVLIGDSQGTFILRALIRDEIDRDRQARRRLVSAMLLGGNVLVSKGERRGGDFDRIPTCQSGRQFRCVVAYSTFNEDPPDDSRFGRPPASASGLYEALELPYGPGYEVACTNPAALSGGVAPLRTLWRAESHPEPVVEAALLLMHQGMYPHASTPWVDPPGHYAGGCVTANGANVLMIGAHDGAPALHWSPEPGFGLHLADVNIAMGDLVHLVGSQSRAFQNADKRRRIARSGS